MHIAICDDDRLWLEYARDRLLAFAKEQNLDLDIVSCENGEDLFLALDREMDAVFLDIELREEDGILLAGEINRRYPECSIIYCTDYLHYATDVYETSHVYYVVKSQFEDRLGSVFSKLEADHEKEKKEVFFHVLGEGMTCFSVNSICTFERKRRYTEIFTSRGCFRIREKIVEVQDLLPEKEFTRCHVSYIVRLSCIVKKQGTEYQLKDGRCIPISRKYMKATREDFLCYCEEQMR